MLRLSTIVPKMVFAGLWLGVWKGILVGPLGYYNGKCIIFTAFPFSLFCKVLESWSTRETITLGCSVTHPKSYLFPYKASSSSRPSTKAEWRADHSDDFENCQESFQNIVFWVFQNSEKWFLQASVYSVEFWGRIWRIAWCNLWALL